MQGAKKQLRLDMKQRLASLTEAAIALASERVCRQLLGCEPVTEAAYLSAYAASGTEIDLAALVRACVQRGQTVCFPRFNGATRLYEMVPCDPADLVSGHWGLMEPRAELPALAEALRREALVWLVPGIAFDAEGGRLGHGGGYYDRMMSGADGLRIGVCHQCQLIEKVPTGENDLKIDRIVTDQRMLICRETTT